MATVTDEFPELDKLPKDYKLENDTSDLIVNDALLLIDKIIEWYFTLLIINKFGLKGYILYMFINAYTTLLEIPHLLQLNTYYGNKRIKLKDGGPYKQDVGYDFRLPHEMWYRHQCMDKMYKEQVNNHFNIVQKYPCVYETTPFIINKNITMILRLIIFIVFCVKSGLFEKSNLNVLNIFKKDFDVLNGSGGFIFK
jgi:hypothetical protein